MKKTLTLLIALLLILSTLIGCANSQSNNGVSALASPGEAEKDVSYGDVSQSFRRSLWDFAGKTSASVLSGERDKNSLYSPMSLYYALAMLEAGAAGQTKTDLQDFLSMTEVLDTSRNLRTLYALMTKEEEGIQEQIANALWIREDLVGEGGKKVKQDWLDQLKNEFYASAFAVDFHDPKTAPKMSEWVAEQTRGKIKPEIDLNDPLLLLVLMNTVYFKANWDTAFDPAHTVKDVFHGMDLDISDVPYLQGAFMSQALLDDHYTAARLSLTEGSIRFVLPEEGMDPEDLLKDPHLLTDLFEREWKNVSLNIALPKFSYKTKVDLLKEMEAIGLTEIVTGSPNFSNMLTTDAEVSAISQETFIALDEKGVEAAAYTEIQIRETGMLEPPEQLTLELNRPFLYVISDGAGAPLFVGIVRNPLAD